jgi:hypothetical protein
MLMMEYRSEYSLQNITIINFAFITQDNKDRNIMKKMCPLIYMALQRDAIYSYFEIRRNGNSKLDLRLCGVTYHWEIAWDMTDIAWSHIPQGNIQNKISVTERWMWERWKDQYKSPSRRCEGKVVPMLNKLSTM